MEQEKTEQQAATITPEEIQEILKQALAQQQQPPSGGPGVTGGFSGWEKPRIALENTNIEKVLVPVELDLRAGKVTVYFRFPGSIAKDQEALMEYVEAMMDQGIPVKAWGRSSSQYSSKYRR